MLRYGSKIVDRIGNIALGSYQTGSIAVSLYDKHIVQGESWDWDSTVQLFSAGVFATTTAVSVKGLKGDVGEYRKVVGSESGSTSDNYVYRALNQKDYDRYTKGLGLEAKNPNGDWDLKEHLVNGSRKASWVNDPYISTTNDLNVANGFNQSGSGYGVVKIDMNKVTSVSYKGYEIYPRVNGVEGLPYHYSIWQQESSVYQSIPFEAIVDYFK